MNDLATRLDAALLDQWEPYALPTAESITAIEAKFAVTIPEAMISLALNSKSFSSFFLSLGPDYEHPSHIIRKNEFIRHDQDWLAAGLGVPAPDNLVFISENFMEDYFWCFDLSQPGPECAIVYWAPDGHPPTTTSRYTTFTSFVTDQINYLEHRPRKAL